MAYVDWITNIIVASGVFIVWILFIAHSIYVSFFVLLFGLFTLFIIQILVGYKIRS